MAYTLNPTTGKLDYYVKLTNPLQFKGTININTDFPLIADVQSGWFYIVNADVTDNAGVLYTNTGLSFNAGDEIVWNGTTWNILGNESIFLRLDQTTPQITIGTFTFPIGVFSTGIYDNSVLSIDPNNRKLYASDGLTAVLDWSSQYLISTPEVATGYISTSGSVVKIDMGNSQLGEWGMSFVPALDWADRRLYASDGSTIMIDWATNTALQLMPYSGNVLVRTASDEGEVFQVQGNMRIDDTGNYSFTPIFGVPSFNKIHTTTTNYGDGGFGMVLVNDISFTDSLGGGNTVGGMGFGIINDGKNNYEGAATSYGIYGYNTNNNGGFSSYMSAISGTTQLLDGSYTEYANAIEGYFGAYDNSTVFSDVKVLYLTASKDAGSEIQGNLYGIKIDDMNIANNNNYAIYTGLGLNRFGDDIIAPKAIPDNYDPDAIANFIGGSLPENMNQKIKTNSVQVQKGTGTVSTSYYTITGVGTNFLTDAEVGDQFYAYDYNNYESYSALITSISSDTSLTVALKFKTARGGSEISGWDYGIQKPLFTVFHSEWAGDTIPFSVFGGNAIIGEGSFGNDANDTDGGIVVGTPFGGNHLLMNDIVGARYAIAAGNYVFNIRSDASGRWETIAYVDGGFNSSKKQLLVNGYVVVDSDTAGLQLGTDQDVLIYSDASGVINIASASPTTTDITMNFGIGATNAGQYLWMEDEDYFKFSDDVLMNSTEKLYFRDTGLYIFSQADGYLNIVSDTGTRLGDATPTNYTQFDADGDMTQVGTARIDWGKKTANNVTLSAGTSTDTVTDLQTLGDGNFYDITEAAATPGINLVVEFINVTAFNWVQIKAGYEGSGSHAVAIQLYNFNTTAWDTFNACQNSAVDTSTVSGYILNSYDFFVPSDTNYIGTGGDAGDVRVRFYHTMAGNASHDLHIDVVALYQ